MSKRSDRIHSLLKADIPKFNSEDQVLLSNLAEAHPYAQTLRLLMCKLYGEEDSQNFKTELVQTAIRTQNRTVLFNLFEKHKPKLSNTAEAETANEKSEELIEIPIEMHLHFDMETKTNKKRKKVAEPYDLEKEYGRFQPKKPGNYGLDVIDEFLSKQPERLNPTRTSTRTDYTDSLEESEDLVSETLAKIYIKQSRLAEAIKMYQKLMLKEPAKSSYFATQISELQKKLD